jgi:Fe-S oxidoreductase
MLFRYKQNSERMYQLKKWQSNGGVMVLGYNMFRNLTNTQTKRIQRKALETFQSTLIDPGEIVFVCDHCMFQITAHLRVCLHLNTLCVCARTRKHR